MMMVQLFYYQYHFRAVLNVGRVGPLPLQDVVPRCLTHCGPQRSADSRCRRTAENRRLAEARQPTQLRWFGA